MINKFFLPCVGLAVGFSLALSAPVLAEPPTDMLTGQARAISLGAYARSTHEVDLDLSGPANGKSRLVVQIPNGPPVTFDRSSFVKRGAGDSLWRGRSQNHDNSDAVFTVKNGLMFGRMTLDNEAYVLRPGKGGKHIIEHVDSDAFPACDAGEDAVFDFADDIASSTLAGSVSNAAGAGTIIDLLSVYTPSVVAKSGSVEAAEALIQAAVDNANAAFANSGVNVVYRLVHTEEVNYVDSGSTSDALMWVSFDAGVAALRDQHGADMVSVIVDTSSSCGSGWVQSNPGAGFASYAFQATDMDCAVGNLSFAHENGHNLGMEHNPENSSAGVTGSSYEHSFGHHVDGSYRTVMSYGAPCSQGCTRVTHHSNPDTVYNGAPTGIAGARDNAQTARQVGPIASAFRESVATSQPPAGGIIIAQSADDVMENSATGEMTSGGTTLEIGYNQSLNANYMVGLRFQGIGVPQLAEITSAYIEFTPAESDLELTDAYIAIEVADNATEFGNQASDLTGRTMTFPVAWSIPSWSASGGGQYSADVSDLVQLVVDRAGWSSGNSVVLAIYSSSGSRRAISYDGDVSSAPRLHIEYNAPAPGNIAPEAGFSFQVSGLTASFTDSSTDADGSISNRQWNFGDGRSSSSRNPSNTYPSAGSYVVSLEVTDDRGAVESISKTVVVSVPQLAVPDAPASLARQLKQSGRGKNKTISSINLSWSHSGVNVDYFELEGCLESGGGKGKKRTPVTCAWSVMQSNITSNARNLAAPTLDSKYRYRLKAVNNIGASGWSNEVKI